MISFEPIFLSLRLAIITTIILFIIGLPIAYWLAFSRLKGKSIVASIIGLPIVLPPSVVGFYLLLTFGSQSVIGRVLHEIFDIRLVFSFSGLVVASLIYSLPFMIYPLQAGLSNLPRSYRETSYCLGKSKWITLWSVLLPNIKPSILTAIIMSFAHTIGEFGVVLMIGGSIPGETRVASIAIYDEVEALNYAGAHQYALVLLIVSFLILVASFWWNKKGGLYV